MADNDRTDSARDHDDSKIIDAATGSPGDVMRSGGGLGRDVGTQDEMKRAVEDPDGHTRSKKQDDINNDVARPNDRVRD